MHQSIPIHLVLPVNTFDIPIIFQCPFASQVALTVNVVVCFQLITHKFIRIKHFLLLDNLLYTYPATICHGRRTNLSFLCSYQNYPVRTSRTIDSRSRRIFQYFNRLDFFGVQHIPHCHLQWKAIHYI